MIGNKLTQIQASIQEATNAVALKYTQKPKDVTLLAVSKKQPATAIHELYKKGQRDFGENYVQEAISKQAELESQKLCSDIAWHFIGPIQSNKTRAIAEHFLWVHSVDRLKIAQRLNDQRPPKTGKLQVCLQINIDHEETKSGSSVSNSFALAKSICSLDQLCLRGIMIIPAQSSNTSSENTKQEHSFVRAKQLFDKIKASLHDDQSIPLEVKTHFDTLSMGMSNDYEHAIENGATIVRIGTKLFGPRA